MKRTSKLFPLAFVVGLASFYAACATAPKHVDRPIVQDHLAEIQRPDIPLVMNDQVQNWLDYFQGRGRPHFERYLRRSGRYVPMIRRVLREQGLPQDLVYLAMIESGFNPHAYSHARASGTWQFIYQTGVRYGLNADQWVDERRDPEKSTVAAAKYLKDLYDRYNNWYLAAAGYNAGEGKIDRAIKKYDTDDFWQLTKGKYLKNETKDYVPKLIAAATIARNPKKYGFNDIVYEEPVAFEEVTLSSPVDLRIAAKLAGTSYEDVKALNPELLHWVTPPSHQNYQLKVPSGHGARFRSGYSVLSTAERMGEEKVKIDESTSVESLAREHGVPSVLLAAANGLDAGETVKAGKTIILPLSPPDGESFYFKDYQRRGRTTMIAYRVRPGDTAQSISRRTGMSVAQLKQNNPHVQWGKVRPGQKINLYAQKSGRKKSHIARRSGKGGKQIAMREKKSKKSKRPAVRSKHK